MKKNLLLLVLILTYGITFAKHVNLTKAKKVAKNIYYERINVFKNIKYEDINLTLVTIKQIKDIDVYYIFNVNKNDGFVIVSADDATKPRIAYSFKKFFSLDHISPEYIFYMKRFEDEIYHAAINKVKPTPEITREWQKYEFTSLKSVNNIQMIQPLVLTEWGQDHPYNDECPSNSQGTALVGCVAVSMGQIMKFWNYPDYGSGSHSYYASGFGTQDANFGATKYVWSNMPNKGTQSNHDLAQLLHHCGVAVEMSYGIDGSGSYSSIIDNQLKQYFKYDDEAKDINRYNYSSSYWLSIIKEEIDAGRPCEYNGASDDGGHSWICDGYNGNELHMNWGWNGYGNGYYSIDNLTPADNSTFDTDGAVIRIHPPAGTYPEGCNSNPKMIVGKEGSFNDGSGNINYDNNLNCTYHILPECSKYVSLKIDKLWLSTGDTLYAYDGNSDNAPLLATYSEGSSAPIVYSTTKNGLFLKFVTDGSQTAEGWYASYHTKSCQFTQYVYDEQGYIEDGSKTCDYNNSISCLWWIEPDNGATAIHIDFEYFELADATDYVKIYKGHSSSSSNLIAELYAGDSPSSYNIPDGKMTVKFASSSTGDVANGWKFHYYTNLNSIERLKNPVTDINIYPNPFKTDATIEFTVEEKSDIAISVQDVVGKTLGTYITNYNVGLHSLKISEIVSDLNQGIYFVNYKANNIKNTVKVIVK